MCVCLKELRRAYSSDFCALDGGGRSFVASGEPELLVEAGEQTGEVRGGDPG